MADINASFTTFMLPFSAQATYALMSNCRPTDADDGTVEALSSSPSLSCCTRGAGGAPAG
jgi:hypothetical protein